MPSTPRDFATPIPTSFGCVTVALWYIAFVGGGYILGRTFAGPEWAVAGGGIGLVISYLTGFFLVRLIRQVFKLKPGTQEEWAVCKAIGVAVTSVLICLTAATIFAAERFERGSIVEAVTTAV